MQMPGRGLRPAYRPVELCGQVGAQVSFVVEGQDDPACGGGQDRPGAVFGDAVGRPGDRELSGVAGVDDVVADKRQHPDRHPGDVIQPGALKLGECFARLPESMTSIQA